MGLFDKKKGDDFNSPVERIDLSTLPLSQTPATAQSGSARAAAAQSSQTAQTAPTAQVGGHASAASLQAQRGRAIEAPEPEVRYGINHAIELMRTLPQDNVELVVQVVKRTLESTHIRIETIIQDATRKQSDIEGRISVLKQEIGELEREIATRRGEIASLDADLRETTTVKDRLVLAEKLTAAVPPAPRAAPVPSQAPAGIAPAATSMASGSVALPGLNPASAISGPRR